jgi:hypothetical protein
MYKVKQTYYSLKHACPGSIIRELELEEAGHKNTYIDENDGREIYMCERMPRDCKPAFIYFEQID